MSDAWAQNLPLRVARDADVEAAEAAARRLAAASVAARDPTGWFESLYVEAAAGAHGIPWDRGEPHRLIVEWAERGQVRGAGGLAIVVGCGLGDDAEFIASLGFLTVAFDVSATAVQTARQRHPGTAVDYAITDLLHLPEHWHRAFDLVVESMTVQSMPHHRQAGCRRGGDGRAACTAGQSAAAAPTGANGSTNRSPWSRTNRPAASGARGRAKW